MPREYPEKSVRQVAFSSACALLFRKYTVMPSTKYLVHYDQKELLPKITYGKYGLHRNENE